MKQAIIVGKTNVGKSLFLISFAEFLGYKNLHLNIKYPNNKIYKKQMSIPIAKKYLSSNENFKTKFLQSVDLKSPFYMGKKTIKMLDSSGFIEDIIFDKNIRNSVAQTLESLNKSDIIIHMIDVQDYVNPIHEDNIDMKIYKYANANFNYVLLVNKIDIHGSNLPTQRISNIFPNTKIFYISSLYKRGFKDVRKYIFKHI